MSCAISMGSSLWSRSASPQCWSLPDQSSLLGAEVMLPHFSQFDYWEASKALPCHHWAGWLTSPCRCLCKDITCHLLWWQIQSRSKMSIKSIQPITVAWMVLGAACIVNHAPWGGESTEKDFVKSPAQSSKTSFFNKCVTLPEKLLLFFSQTRLIFL